MRNVVDSFLVQKRDMTRVLESPVSHPEQNSEAEVLCGFS